MRQITKNLYSFNELSESAKEYALNKWREDNTEIFWGSEIMDSLKALFKNVNGVKLLDYSIGAYERSYIKISFSNEASEDLTGKRAYAWLENNLFLSLRIPFKGSRRAELNKYGAYYRAGMIPPCPLTGVCFDEDFINDLKDSIKSKMTLKEAFLSLGDKAQKLMENELENQNSMDYFADHAEANNFEFLENGERE